MNAEQTEALGRNRRGTALLCHASGETDRAGVALIKSIEELAEWLIAEWLGDPNSENLAPILEDVADHDWDDGPIDWRFEIGGVRIEDVGVTLIKAQAQQQAVALAPDSVIDRLWEASAHGTRREDVVAAFNAGAAHTQQQAASVPEGWLQRGRHELESIRKAVDEQDALIGDEQLLTRLLEAMLASPAPTVPAHGSSADVFLRQASLLIGYLRSDDPKQRTKAADDLMRVCKSYATAPADVMADAWQPIETAPKDGTTILVLCPDSTHRNIDAAHYHEDPWHTLKRPWCSSWCVDGLPVSGTPTRWMPLPPDHVECAAEKGTT